MSLKTCKVCQGEIDTDLKSCPHCGASINCRRKKFKRFLQKLLFWKQPDAT